MIKLEWFGAQESAKRPAWCIQDAAGHCLAHVEHIVGQDRDVETAIRVAKRMIIDGGMPTPEEARRQLNERLEWDRLGEPFTMEVPDEMPVSINVELMHCSN